MSRVELFRNVASSLRSLADSVQAEANSIGSNEPSEVTKPEEKQITLEEVRAVLADKSHDGFTDEVRALLEKHGASKLSEIDPSKYAALLADAEALK